MYKRIIKNIIRETELNFHNADQKDVERSAYTAGYVSALIGLLNGMGHKVKSGDWDDNGCSRVGCLEIDGKVLIKNSRIDYKAVDREYKMKTTPEQLAEAVLGYCEAEGYTLGEVQDLDNGICKGVRKMFDKCRCMKFTGDRADE